jgi:hypothetical protein
VLFWAKNFADFTCLQELLQSAGRNDLVPTRPKLTVEPLTWWDLARTELGLEDSLSLNLGNVYELLFPERPELYENKHRASSDVCMTIELIEFISGKSVVSRKRGRSRINFLADRDLNKIVMLSMDQETTGKAMRKAIGTTTRKMSGTATWKVNAIVILEIELPGIP